MGQVIETVSSVTNLIRTLLFAAIVGAVGYGGGWLYQNVFAVTLAQHREQIHELQQELDRLETAMQLLKVDQRTAEVQVLGMFQDPTTQKLNTQITFVELDREGNPIGTPQQFTVEGDLLYVDYWIVKFEDKYVEQADLHRATSICLFRRLFGEHQPPNEGFVLDPVGTRPHAYGRGPDASEFEQQIWSDFWNIASDPDRAQELGIRAAHGDAPYTRLREGQTYRLILRASDGLSIVPVPAEAAARSAPL